MAQRRVLRVLNLEGAINASGVAQFRDGRPVPGAEVRVGYENQIVRHVAKTGAGGAFQSRLMAGRIAWLQAHWLASDPDPCPCGYSHPVHADYLSTKFAVQGSRDEAEVILTAPVDACKAPPERPVQ